MKLTKKLEAEILKVYNTYWESYSTGDIKTFATTLDKTFEMIGTSETEICHTKEEGIKFVKAQIKELVGKVEMRNRKISVVPVNEMMLVNERCDIYIRMGQDWKFYSKIRISTCMRKTNSGWKVFQQHGSLPDIRVEEGETLALKKINKENLQLRDAIKRRTIELEEKNRELEIEASLERVRSRAMAMHTSDELKEVAKEMRNQLHLLGQKELETCAIHLWDESSGQFEAWAALRSPDNTGKIIESESKFKIKGIKILEENFQHYRDGKKDYVLINDVAKAKEFFEALKYVDPKAYAFLSPTIKNKKPGDISAYWAVADFTGGSLVMVTMKSPEDNSRALLRRFADVFGLAYRRFSDLQKAEAQAREAQIEVALEKVRSRTMGMQKSEELKDVINLVYEQITHLNIHVEHCGFLIDYKTRDDLHIWLADEHLAPSEVIFPWFDCPPNNAIRDAKDKGEDFFFYHLNFKEKNKFYRDLFKLIPGIPEETIAYYLHCPGLAGSGVLLESIGLYIENFSGTVYSAEENAVLMRFGKVFQQTYTRFLDLQKAEAQAREAQIEAALERVRARTMAMQKSSELNPTADLLFEQLRLLGAELQGVAFAICDKDNDIVQKWTSIGVFSFSSSIEPAEQNMYEAWKNKIPLYEEVFEGERIKKYYETLMEVPAFKKGLQQLLDAGIPMPTWQKNHAVSFQQGYLLIITTKPFAETQIFIRFGKVFEQTYTRFLDLQKAEAQAREAQIEAALERVRSRSMAMHKSEELLEVINVVSNQLQQLDIRFGFVCFGVIHPQGNLDFWMAVPGFDQPEKIHMPFVNNPITNSLIEAHKKGTRVLKDIFPKEVMLDWSKTLFENNPDSQIMAQSKEYIQESPGLVRTTVILKEIDVFAGKFADKSFTDEQNEIIVRFANVFEQSYIRFLDLQKAEMQAREAKIEVSLEKVRTVALILKKSDEMLDVVQALYEALYDLGFTNIRNSIIDVHNPQKETFLDYDYSPQLGRSITEMSYYDSPFIENQVRKTEADNDAFFELILEGKELQELIDMRLKNGEAEDVRLRQTKQLTYNLYSFGNGAIGISNFGLLSDEEKEILKRFRNVFAFAYKRYSDMVQAEALAREAQIEAALEKVRSRTLAMQKSDELADTAAVLFQQLITLGIAPNRLFIIIMKAGSSDLEAWVTDEDGSKVSIAFTADYQKNLSIKKMYEGWQQQKKSLVIDMQGEELQQYFHYLHDELKVPFKGGLEQKRRIQHLAYFSHGLIGMASPEEQPAETIQLLERFAAVFNLTFTRFNDLKIAEAHAIQAEQDLIAIKEAKQKAEEALTELQSTQKQLIQSEKMASLGELTAGIAHEIQNPLNFVNNFSEVSKELLDEMKEAIEKGDTEDAKQIMNDVIQNLEKINHHGKRADGIVKGMLQHSRSSTGQKELTDINVLCDEYLRLSYHGLRAKDKTFNAKFETDFDETVGKLNVIPQDIGRVVLNLINNAFYAVSERKKLNEPGYEPTVIVSTIKETDAIKIKVKDNGTGIPQKVLDKIFQPFFTTKPTGQGTGLGLSLSYDIVTKGHGGELKVETKEGEFSKFTITIPV